MNLGKKGMKGGERRIGCVTTREGSCKCGHTCWENGGL